MKPSLFYADEGCAFGALGSVLLTAMRRPPTGAQMRELRRHVAHHHREFGGKIRAFSLLERDAISIQVPSEVREETTSQMRDFPGLGTVVVVEGSGFRPAAMRALLSGIHLVLRPPYPFTICSTVDAGARWAAARGDPHGEHLGPADLSAALEATRAELQSAP